jgi:hypothetical protein
LAFGGVVRLQQADTGAFRLGGTGLSGEDGLRISSGDCGEEGAR